MVSKLNTLVKLLSARIFRLFSYLVPRSRSIWMFTGWHNGQERQIFADNSKYMFLHVANNEPRIKAIWIAEDKKLAGLLQKGGYQAYSFKSLRGIYYSLRAGYTFVDAFMKLHNWQLAGGSKVIQLWHGKGMKKTGHDSPYSLKRYNSILFPNLFIKFYRLVASSPYTAKLMATTFKAPETDILVTGLPRNDVLRTKIPGAEIDSHTELDRIIEEAKRQGRQRILLYAPTFRPSGSNPLATFEFKRCNDWLRERNWHLIISLHPKFATKEGPIATELSHVSSIGAGYDVYPQLHRLDMLITDYSSLYVDFLQLDRPIVFYTFDLEKYQIDMGLHSDFLDLTPGPRPKTFDELLSAIESPDTFETERARVREILHSYHDSNASKRITAALL